MRCLLHGITGKVIFIMNTAAAAAAAAVGRCVPLGRSLWRSSYVAPLVAVVLFCEISILLQLSCDLDRIS